MPNTLRLVRPMLLVLVAAALVLTGCSSDDSSDESGSGDEATSDDSASAGGGGSDEPAAGGGEGGDAVAIVDFAFDPDGLTVAAGTTVTFTNEDSATHTATADDDSFDTGDLAEGDSGEVTFDEAGEFSYFCDIHNYMKGTVTVE